MAQIISSGQVSVYDMNDIYSSTTAPTNPTEGSLWFNQNDNKLYVYSNGQWIFSSEGLIVGGTNLLKNTSKFQNTTNWSLSVGTGVTGVLSIINDATYGSVLQATKTADGGSWWVLGNTGLTMPNSKFIVGKDYTLSFFIKNDFPLYVNFMDGNGTNSVASANKQININSTWTKYVWTFKANATGNTPQLYIAKSSASLGTVQITKIQLEQGNVPTDYTSAPEDTETVIIKIQDTLGNMANDNIIDYGERQVIKDTLTEVLGYVIANDATTLPTTATLDVSGKGDFYNVRMSSTLAGVSTSDTKYINVLTQYNNLKTYLEGLTPIKPWDLSTANQSTIISVTKDTFRTKWVDYYNAVSDLATLTAQKLKENVDNVIIGGRNFAINSNFSKYTQNSSVGWDNALNGTLTIDNWSGYNNSVTSPSTGYHAHVNTTKFVYPVLELIDRNSTYGGLHRWLASSQKLSSTSSFSGNLAVGKSYTLSMEVYSDTVGSLINTGIYHYKKSTGVLNFHGFQWNLDTCKTANTWEKKSITFTIDSDWDLTKENNIYIYGQYSSMECSQWVKNVKLEEGTKASSWSPAPEDIDAILADIASDNKLTPSEKQFVKKEWDAIVAEKTTIDSQADVYLITTEKTNYGTTYNTLNTYLTPLLVDLTTTSDIVGTTFRSNFKDYYDKRAILVKAITDKALQSGKDYNGVKVDATNGLVVTSSKNIATFSASKGIEIKRTSDSVVIFSLDSTTGNLTVTGNINMTGGSIAWGTGAGKVTPPTASDVGAITATYLDKDGIYTGKVLANSIQAGTITGVTISSGRFETITTTNSIVIENGKITSNDCGTADGGVINFQTVLEDGRITVTNRNADELRIVSSAIDYWELDSNGNGIDSCSIDFSVNQHVMTIAMRTDVLDLSSVSSINWGTNAPVAKFG